MIVILDLHNTLYDEVLEYGEAMAAAIRYFQEAAIAQGKTLEEHTFKEAIAQAHFALGSDWDDGVWDATTAIQHLDGFAAIRDAAKAERLRVSEKLTEETVYPGLAEALRALKGQGHSVYIATEATENAATDAVRWLGLDGVVDAVYAWPYARSYTPLKYSPVYPFPVLDTGISLQKPHPLILGVILLREAQRRGIVPANRQWRDCFTLSQDESLDLSALESRITTATPQGRNTLAAIRTTLSIRRGSYQMDMQTLREGCVFIGDSFFKDGFMARNAGIRFIHAQYGKTIAPEMQARFDAASHMLYDVTGWDRFLLQLTHEAGRLPELMEKIKPHAVCEDSRNLLSLLQG